MSCGLGVNHASGILMPMLTRSHLMICTCHADCCRTKAMMFANVCVVGTVHSPRSSRYEYCVREGEKSTYALVLPIKTRCRVEQALHKAVWDLRMQLQERNEEGEYLALPERKGPLERPATPVRPSWSSTPTPTLTVPTGTKPS